MDQNRRINAYPALNITIWLPALEYKCSLIHSLTHSLCSEWAPALGVCLRVLLTMHFRLACNMQSPCLNLSSAEIKSMHDHTQHTFHAFLSWYNNQVSKTKLHGFVCSPTFFFKVLSHLWLNYWNLRSLNYFCLNHLLGTMFFPLQWLQYMVNYKYTSCTESCSIGLMVSLIFR